MSGGQTQLSPVPRPTLRQVKQWAASQGWEVFGRGGQNLAEYWTPGPGKKFGGGPRTLKSFCTRNFPNLFFLNGPQGALVASATYILDGIRALRDGQQDIRWSFQHIESNPGKQVRLHRVVILVGEQ